MVLADEDIEGYIMFDQSDHKDPAEDGLTVFQKNEINKKLMFRDRLCQKVSILRLSYMLTVLHACHPGKASMLGAEAFKAKLMKEDTKDKRKSDFREVKADGNNATGGSIDIQ